MMEEMTQVQFELWMGSMDGPSRRQWMSDKIHDNDYTLPRLPLALKRGAGPPAKPPSRYNTPVGLADAVREAIDRQIAKHHCIRVPFHHTYFITPGFAKLKKGRLWPGTSIYIYQS